MQNLSGFSIESLPDFQVKYYGKRKYILQMQYFKREKVFSGPIREATQVSLENEVRRRQILKNPAQ